MMLQDFLSGCPHSSSSKTPADLLLNRKILENYYHQMKDIKMYQPTTITEKLRKAENGNKLSDRITRLMIYRLKVTERSTFNPSG